MGKDNDGLMSYFDKKNLGSDSTVVIVIAMVLAVIGLFTVYSASWYTASTLYGDKFMFLKKQLVGVAIGVCGLLFFTFFKHLKLKKYAMLAVIISVVMLILVFIPVIGVEKYGAKRWINLGVMTVQPSEIAKFAIILFSAKVLSKSGSNDKGLKSKLPVIAVGGIICLLILIEPNLSITVCVALLLFSMLVIGGVDVKYIVAIIGLGLLALPILIIMEPYRLDRLMAFLDPWASPKGEGYQLIQSLYSIANGGLFGVGYLNSRQALRFLPFSESDFIFPIFAEEFGLVGAIALILLYFVLIVTGFRIALKANEKFTCFLAFGITMLIAIQVAINLLVVTGSIPPTGLPLPLISSGNTQIIMFMSEIGILANCGREVSD